MHIHDRVRRSALCLAALLSLASFGPLGSRTYARDLPDTTTEALEDVASKAGKATGRPFAVDEVWGGTGVIYDAIADGPIVYVGYYDAQRRLAVTRIDTTTGKRKKKILDSRFGGWDAHNYVTIQLDSKGILHVAGNMHASPLVYGRTLKRGDFDSLSLAPLVGRDEGAVTYPRFFNFPNGDLGFSYRLGGSGNGTELIDRFDGQRWLRALNTPLFGPESQGKHVNAYHSGYILGNDGFFHIAWVWRATPAAETNFDLNYAKSKDLQHWETSRGTPVRLPITPDNAEIVDRIPQKSGLVNNVKVGFDTKGKPVISYIRFDKAGNSQLYHARPYSDGGWQIVPATTWDFRWDIEGRGTLVSPINFSGVRIKNNQMIEDVTHKKYGTVELALDEKSLKSQPIAVPAAAAAKLGRASSVNPPYRVYTRPVRTYGTGSIEAVVRWESLGVENNDKPRTCESSNLPKNCSMTSLMEIFVR